MNLVIKILLPVLLVMLPGGNLFSQNASELPDLLAELSKANDSLKPKIYSRLGFYYLRRDQYDSALYYANQGLLASEKINDVKAVANFNNNMGSIHRIYSDYNKAIELFTKALEVYEKNNYYREAARTISNIAAVYGEQLQHDKAIEQLLLSNLYSVKAKDTITLIQNYSSLANNYSFKKDFLKARTNIDSGLVLAEAKSRSPLQPGAESAQFGFAVHYLNKMHALQLYNEKKFEASVALYKKEIAAIEEGGGIHNKVDLIQGLSENFIELNKYDSALFYTDAALDLLKEDSIPKSYMDVYKLRSVIYEKMGRYKEALYAQQLYKTFSDSIRNTENVKTITSIQTLYETAKKDKQILQLNQEKNRQRNTIILAACAALIVLVILLLAYRSRLLRQKLYKQRMENRMIELEQMALRAQMNPHFIFNSLNSVQHFVMNKDVEGVNSYLGIFARLVRQTLDNSGKALIPLDEEIKYLDTYLSLEKLKSNNKFDYAITVNNNIDPSGIFIPGMILQPFVENSILHGISHKEKNDGLVKISISKNGRLVCMIDDNGIGRERSSVLKTSVPDHGSRGMDITMHRIEAINKMYNSSISVQFTDMKDEAGNPSGTSVKVELPADME
jgi:tetratricopeptide (TPR) repeat protein